MWIGPAVAVAVAGWLEPESAIAAAPFLVAWVVAPVWSWWLSRPISAAGPQLAAAERTFLRTVARRTWRFFEVHVTAGDQFLPPDNVQHDPPRGVAHRTSPTNIGMSLISNLAAYDFGYLSAGELIARTTQTFATLDRMQRYRGHFYNWYDTPRSSRCARPTCRPLTRQPRRAPVGAGRRARRARRGAPGGHGAGRRARHPAELAVAWPEVMRELPSSARAQPPPSRYASSRLTARAHPAGPLIAAPANPGRTARPARRAQPGLDDGAAGSDPPGRRVRGPAARPLVGARVELAQPDRLVARRRGRAGEMPTDPRTSPPASLNRRLAAAPPGARAAWVATPPSALPTSSPSCRAGAALPRARSRLRVPLDRSRQLSRSATT